MEMTLEKAREYDTYSIFLREILIARCNKNDKNMANAPSDILAAMLDELKNNDSIRSNDMRKLAFINFVVDAIGFLQGSVINVNYEEEKAYASYYCAVQNDTNAFGKSIVRDFVISNNCNLDMAMSLVLEYFYQMYHDKQTTIHTDFLLGEFESMKETYAIINSLCPYGKVDENWVDNIEMEAYHDVIVAMVTEQNNFQDNPAICIGMTRFVINAIEKLQGNHIEWSIDDGKNEDGINLTVKRDDGGKLIGVYPSSFCTNVAILNYALTEYEHLYEKSSKQSDASGLVMRKEM